MVQLRRARFLLLLLACAAAACGGGGGGGGSPPPPPDSTPAPFSFAAATDVAPAAVTDSAAVTILGINVDTAISIQGGEYAVNGGSFTSSSGIVRNGDRVAVRVIASSDTNSTVSATLTVGGISSAFEVTTKPDTTPLAFAFVEQTDVDLDVSVESNAVVISDIEVPASISIVGGEYAIDGGSFTSVAGTIADGQSLVLRVMSASTPSTLVTATVTVDTVMASFNVTTLADLEAPTATVHFPPLVSRTTESNIRFRGTAEDNLSTITALSINGTPASTTDNFATWSVDVPLSAGVNMLDLQTEDAEGNVDTTAVSAIVTRNFRFGLPTALALDAANDRVFAVDSEADALVAVDLTTGLRDVVSDDIVPDGNYAFEQPVAVVHDAANNRVFVLEAYGGVIEVDLATGVRTYLSGLGVPDSANLLVGPSDMVLDAANNRLLVVSRGGQSVIAVDTTSGARTVISNSTTPDGTNFFYQPTAIALDVGFGRALVTNAGPDIAVYAVDLSTGARSILSDDSTPDASNPLSLPSDIVIDAVNGRALVAQPETQSVMAVDLVSGARSVFSDSSTPDAVQPFELAPALELDTANERLLVLDQAARTIIAASLVTGARTVLSPSELGDTGVRLDEPRGIALDADSARLLVTADGASDAVIAIAIDTAQRSILSDATTPDPMNPFHAPIDLVLGSNSAYVLEASEGMEGARIVSVDLATGARTVLSSAVVPDSVAALDLPFGLALDEPGNRLLVTDAGLTAVVSVDVAAGSRTILSDNATPDANLPFSTPTGIALDTSRGRAIVANSDMSFDSNLLGVDFGSGARALISDAVMPEPSSPLFDPGAVAVDATNDRAFIVNRFREELLVIDLATGARTPISLNSYLDFEVPFAAPGRIAYDPERRIVFLVNEGADAVLAIDETTGRRVYLLR